MGIVTTSPEAIERAAAALTGGSLVAFPTETVYGLGADATNARAVAAIFEAKGRPTFNPLIMHVATREAAAELGQLTKTAGVLARPFWPGPLTLVLRKRQGCPVVELATAGLDTIAVRVPAHPVAQALLKAAGVPIAAPSANRSGHVSPTTAAHVAEDLGDRVAMILDGGAAPIGLESTVVDVTGAEP
ncbi:MAG: threonylcarbamoyl-AMP synthase, partial [Hyphomicrobiaceae bacterium]|nr:threonylcarbamoyl-AMP synthase [Hyphomicrobiaceae bacterium]